VEQCFQRITDSPHAVLLPDLLGAHGLAKAILSTACRTPSAIG
jgi:hypothetical protein